MSQIAMLRGLNGDGVATFTTIAEEMAMALENAQTVEQVQAIKNEVQAAKDSGQISTTDKVALEVAADEKKYNIETPWYKRPWYIAGVSAVVIWWWFNRRK